MPAAKGGGDVVVVKKRNTIIDSRTWLSPLPAAETGALEAHPIGSCP